jgi:7-cyano-7-deazaguanine synthase
VASNRDVRRQRRKILLADSGSAGTTRRVLFARRRASLIAARALFRHPWFRKRRARIAREILKIISILAYATITQTKESSGMGTSHTPSATGQTAPAVVLLSGGLDSATALAIAQSQGFEAYALSFRYGQRHEHELTAARRVAERARVARHVIAEIDLRAFGGSALTDSRIDVPKGRAPAEMCAAEIPVTYVPARNTIFLAFALAWAETLGSSDIFIGVNALDYSGYPDCRPEYIEAFTRMSDLATKAGVHGRQHLRIHTPLIQMTKAEIIRTGLKLGVDYSITSTCYDPTLQGLACGACDACVLRLKGFAENGILDPAQYVGRPP